MCVSQQESKENLLVNLKVKPTHFLISKQIYLLENKGPLMKKKNCFHFCSEMEFFFFFWSVFAVWFSFFFSEILPNILLYKEKLEVILK